MLLRRCGFVKVKGFSICSVIYSLLIQVFNFPNMSRRLNSSWGRSTALECGKDVFYDALNNPFFNWTKLVLLLAASFVKKTQKLKTIKGGKSGCFIIDDTMMQLK